MPKQCCINFKQSSNVIGYLVMQINRVNLAVIVLSGMLSVEASAGISLWSPQSSKAETAATEESKYSTVYSRVMKSQSAVSFGQKFRRLSLRWASWRAPQEDATTSGKSVTTSSNSASLRRSNSGRSWRVSRRIVTPVSPPVTPRQPAPEPEPAPAPAPKPAPEPKPQPIPTLGKAVLSWQIPTERENGTALPVSEIASYEIYYTAEKSGASQTIVVNQATQKSYTVSGLKPDSYHFSMVTVDSDGVYSELSKVVSKTIN